MKTSSGRAASRRAVEFGALCAGALLIAFGALQALQTRDRARAALERALSQATGLRARVAGAELELARARLVAHGVELDDDAGAVRVRARRVIAPASLRALLLGKLEPSSIEAFDVSVTLRTDAERLRSGGSGPTARRPMPALALHDAAVRIELAALPALVLHHAELSAQPSEAGARVRVACKDAALVAGGATLMRAQLRAEVQLAALALPLRARGSAQLEAIRVRDPVYDVVERATLALRVDAQGAALRGPLSLRSGLGALQLSATWKPAAARPFTLELEPHGLGLGALAQRLGWRAPWIDAQLDGEVALDGSLAPLSLAGSLRLDARALHLGTATASALWQAPRAQVHAGVRLRSDGIACDGVSLAAGRDAGFSAGALRMQDGGRVWRFERAELHSGEHHVAADELVLDLRDSPRLDAKLRIMRLPLSELYRALGAEGDPVLSRLQALCAGRAEFSYVSSAHGAALGLTLALDLHDALLDGYAFETGRLRARVELPDAGAGVGAGTVTLDRLALATGKGTLELAGELRRGALALELSAQGLPLSRLPWIARHAPALRATLDAKGALSGSSSDPRADVALALEDVHAGAVEFGRAQLRARLSQGAPAPCGEDPARAPLPQAHAGAVWSICGSGLRDHARLALAIEAAPQGAVRGRLELAHVALEPYLPHGASGAALPGQLVAALDLEGASLASPAQWNMPSAVEQLTLGEGEAALASEAPFAVRVRRGALSMQHGSLRGPKLRFSLGAEGSWGHGARLVADGTASASLWSAPHVQPNGDVRVHAELDLDGEPALRARLQPEDVFLRIGDGLYARKLNGTLEIAGSRVRLRDVNAELGGGSLALSGELSLRGLALAHYDLALSARRISLQPQPRFELTFDADARLRGGAHDTPRLSGVLHIEHLLYARHIEFPQALMAMNREQRAEAAAYDAARDRIAFDLEIEHDQPLHVRNNVLDADVVVSGADHKLRLVGSDQRPGLLGKVAITRGRVLFRGDEFRVTRGEIAFQDPDRIDPRFDVRAVAQAHKSNRDILFSAHGDRDAFAVRVRCNAGEQAEPPPFACDYAGNHFHCDDLERLVQLWVCRPKPELSAADAAVE